MERSWHYDIAISFSRTNTTEEWYRSPGRCTIEERWMIRHGHCCDGAHHSSLRHTPILNIEHKWNQTDYNGVEYNDSKMLKTWMRDDSGQNGTLALLKLSRRRSYHQKSDLYRIAVGNYVESQTTDIFAKTDFTRKTVSISDRYCKRLQNVVTFHDIFHDVSSRRQQAPSRNTPGSLYCWRSPSGSRYCWKQILNETSRAIRKKYKNEFRITKNERAFQKPVSIMSYLRNLKK